MIITVKQPTFLINLDNPTEISYERSEERRVGKEC